MKVAFTEELKETKKKDWQAFLMVSMPIALLSWMMIAVLYRNELPYVDRLYVFTHWFLLTGMNLFSLSSIETFRRIKEKGYVLDQLSNKEKTSYLQLVYGMMLPVIYLINYVLISPDNELGYLLLHFGLVLGGTITVFTVHIMAITYLQPDLEEEFITEQQEEIIENKEERKTFTYLATSSDYALSTRIVQIRHQLKNVIMKDLAVEHQHDIELGIELFNKGLVSYEALPEKEQQAFRTYMDWVLDYLQQQLDEIEEKQYKTHRDELIKMKARLQQRG